MHPDNLTNYPIVPTEIPADTPPIRVAFVGCGKTKVTHPARARDLYTGNLFRAATAHAEANYDDWFVLSARYGIVWPDAIIGPYEATMDTKTVDQTTAWVNKVDSQLRGSTGPGYGLWTNHGGRLVIDIYAGRAYADPLLKHWEGLSWKVTVPHAGLEIGQRLQAFKEARAA